MLSSEELAEARARIAAARGSAPVETADDAEARQRAMDEAVAATVKTAGILTAPTPPSDPNQAEGGPR